MFLAYDWKQRNHTIHLNKHLNSYAQPILIVKNTMINKTSSIWSSKNKDS